MKSFFLLEGFNFFEAFVFKFSFFKLFVFLGDFDEKSFFLLNPLS
ncbi:hypothetical protein L935_00120 [Helicobacter pylori PZ5086]|nr:hypothetical protein L935_00120 [Helicobacter pylori PZ5086]